MSVEKPLREGTQDVHSNLTFNYLTVSIPNPGLTDLLPPSKADRGVR